MNPSLSIIGDLQALHYNRPFTMMKDMMILHQLRGLRLTNSFNSHLRVVKRKSTEKLTEVKASDELKKCLLSSLMSSLVQAREGLSSSEIGDKTSRPLLKSKSSITTSLLLKGSAFLHFSTVSKKLKSMRKKYPIVNRLNHLKLKTVVASIR